MATFTRISIKKCFANYAEKANERLCFGLKNWTRSSLNFQITEIVYLQAKPVETSSHAMNRANASFQVFSNKGAISEACRGYRNKIAEGLNFPFDL